MFTGVLHLYLSLTIASLCNFLSSNVMSSLLYQLLTISVVNMSCPRCGCVLLTRWIVTFTLVLIWAISSILVMSCGGKACCYGNQLLFVYDRVDFARSNLNDEHFDKLKTSDVPEVVNDLFIGDINARCSVITLTPAMIMNLPLLSCKITVKAISCIVLTYKVIIMFCRFRCYYNKNYS
jgi:hypothetical protein